VGIVHHQLDREIRYQKRISQRGIAEGQQQKLDSGHGVGFLEGEAGTGKTEIAKALAAALGRRLIRLQCYEGLDAASAVYEWNFAAQMIAIRAAEAAGGADRDMLPASFSPRTT
jgi:DNA repair ATPase RecN